jgi:hypothetical protein
MDEITLDSGDVCKVVHRFSHDRLLVDYDGLFVLVDKVLGVWVLSGRPADAEEREVMNPLIQDMKDSVKVVKH